MEFLFLFHVLLQNMRGDGGNEGFGILYLNTETFPTSGTPSLETLKGLARVATAAGRHRRSSQVTITALVK